MSKQWKDYNTIVETQVVEKTIDIQALQDGIAFHQEQINNLQAEINAALEGLPARPKQVIASEEKVINEVEEIV